MNILICLKQPPKPLEQKEAFLNHCPCLVASLVSFSTITKTFPPAVIATCNSFSPDTQKLLTWSANGSCRFTGSMLSLSSAIKKAQDQVHRNSQVLIPLCLRKFKHTTPRRMLWQQAAWEKGEKSMLALTQTKTDLLHTEQVHNQWLERNIVLTVCCQRKTTWTAALFTSSYLLLLYII